MPLAASPLTRSSPATMTLIMVSMYQELEGAKRSAAWAMRATRSPRRKRSCAAFKCSSSFCVMTCTFTGLIMRYSRSSVLRLSVSSGSSRHSMTAIWWSAAYLGWSRTMLARPVMPKYFKLWLSDVMKRAMDAAAASSRLELG